MYGSVLHLVVHLVTKMSTSCLPLIHLLLDIASPPPTSKFSLCTQFATSILYGFKYRVVTIIRICLVDMEMDESDADILVRDDDTLTLPDLHQLPAVSSAAAQLLVLVACFRVA